MRLTVARSTVISALSLELRCETIDGRCRCSTGAREWQTGTLARNANGHHPGSSSSSSSSGSGSGGGGGGSKRFVCETKLTSVSARSDSAVTSLFPLASQRWHLPDGLTECRTFSSRPPPPDACSAQKSTLRPPAPNLIIILTHTQAKKGSPYSTTERRVPELIPVLGSQPAGDMSHKPGGRLPLLSARPAVPPATLKRGCYQFCCLVNKGTMGVNSLPKPVTRQRRGCDLNPGPSASESSTLTARP